MSVSVIIPTLNEESCLAETLGQLRCQRPHEVIVVDGGSSDATCRLAAEADPTQFAAAEDDVQPRLSKGGLHQGDHHADEEPQNGGPRQAAGEVADGLPSRPGTGARSRNGTRSFKPSIMTMAFGFSVARMSLMACDHCSVSLRGS